jgi:oligogalacturonide transport system substrate-binding protein
MDGYQQKLMTQLAGGTAPDVFQIDPPWLGGFGSSDFLLNIKGNQHFDFSQFSQTIIDSFCTVNGKTLGLPSGSNGFTFVANKNFLEKHNISLDTQFTWDSFIAKGRQIHNANPNEYLTAWDPIEGEYFIEEYVRMKTGRPWLSDDFVITATRADIVEAYAKLRELYTSGTCLPLGEVQPYITSMNQSPKWINGQIGGFYDLPSKLSMWMGSVSYPITTLDSPKVDGARDTSRIYRPTHIMSINAKSANVDEACKFLNWFLNNPDAIMILKDCRSVPTSKIALKTLEDAKLIDPEVSKAIGRIMADPAKANPYVMGDEEIFSFLMDEFQNVAYGISTPEKAADSLIKRTQDRLDSLKKSK